ncbi:MAG TPA: hypothetical protein VKG01_02925 [Thermoanaerobaculia bacterium]|nr:hypothetical protein [Thermoanaerobaculia bacterium]
MSKSVYRGTRSVLGAVVLLLASAPAWAQIPEGVPENVRFRIGGIFASFSTEIIASRPGAPGSDINFTSEGLTDDHKNTFRGEGYWNFAGRSYLDFGYVKFSLEGSKQITKDFTFNGDVYKAGAQVSGETSSQYIYGAYRYGIVKNPNVHFGLSLGVSYAKLSAKLSATAGVQRPDGTVIQGGASTERSISVPVPLLGADLEFQLAKGLTVMARVRGVGVTIDPYSGSWIEGAAGLNWYFGEHFGVGGAYEYQKITLKKDESTPDAFRFEQRYDGPRAYFLLTF